MARRNQGQYAKCSIFVPLARTGVWHVANTVLPSFLIVLVSATAHWISHENLGERLGVMLTSFLTLMANKASINGDLPKLPCAPRPSLGPWVPYCVNDS